MAGAFVPDLARVGLGIDGATVPATLNLPFSWFAIHVHGGTLVCILIGATVAASNERRRVLELF